MTAPLALGYMSQDDRDLRDAKRDELWSEGRCCDHCWNVITVPADSVALYFNEPEEWRLVHAVPCAVDSMIAENRRLAEMQEESVGVCFECDAPVAPGYRLCARHYVESKL